MDRLITTQRFILFLCKVINGQVVEITLGIYKTKSNADLAKNHLEESFYKDKFLEVNDKLIVRPIFFED